MSAVLFTHHKDLLKVLITNTRNNPDAFVSFCFLLRILSESEQDPSTMHWATLALALASVSAIHAQTAARMLRFACSQLVVERLDPLVTPGVVGSPHTHQIVGGNSFNATMEPVEYDLPSRSNCTSCTFSEDFSNYWTAAMYYRARNGTYKRVAQFPNAGLNQNGGITVYYIPPYDRVTNVTAFKPVS